MVAERVRFASIAFHAPLTLRLSGPVSAPALRAALERVVRRHDSLRTRFPLVDDLPVQVVDEPGRLGLAVVDLSALLGEEAVACGLPAAEGAHPYDLERGPLVRATLVRLAPAEHILIVGLHHLVTDLWSMSVLAGELAALLAAAGSGRPAGLPDVPLQYPQYAVEQRQRLSGGRRESLLDWWRERLDAVRPLPLPLDHRRPARPNLVKDVRWTAMEPGAARRLRELAHAAGCTPSAALLAAFQILLARLSGQDAVLVATPTAGRTDPRTERATGFFIRTVWLRGDLGDRPSYRRLLVRAGRELTEALDHSEVPFEDVIAAVDPARDLDPHPLRQIGYSFHNVPWSPLTVPGVHVSAVADAAAERPEQVVNGSDLELLVFDGGDGLNWGLASDPALFDPQTVAG